MHANHQQPVVLYVEDDPHSRKLMGMLLKGRMKLTQVTILQDAQNFIQIVNALDPKPTVIFLDIHVKPLNGFEMLALLRAQEWCARVPVIALTASVMNEEVRRLEEAGFDGCLSKPIDMDTFPGTLEQILAGERIWRIVTH
ncbi:MAG: response regulator [Candidatus Flexifilum sp.]|jgi:CheY-like chemotaxis protein